MPDLPSASRHLASVRPAQEERASDPRVDKNIAPLLRLADRHYILEKDRTVWSGSSAELAAAVELQHRYLGRGLTGEIPCWQAILFARDL
jgi:hypothetical protein